MNTCKIGFLPLYIKLYDDCGLTIRERLEPFYEKLAAAFEEDGFSVLRTSFCRVKEEFAAAVAMFEENDVDCIVTWHAAYSPSLESIEALSQTKLPIVVLDTTETFDFSPSQSPDEININHGIHGVMDMTNMLRRHGKAYAIAAGPYPQSDVVKRAGRLAQIAAGANSLAGSRVGTIGGSFDGMGDFLISDEELLERFGVTAVYAKGNELSAFADAVTEEEISTEIDRDLDTCQVLAPFSRETHAKTVKNCLAVRKWLEQEKLDAFTVNFREIRPENGLTVMPFMEACKAMARGIGYAGEGDVLTAALTGALMRGFGDVSFVEIFCPDWQGGSLFLSHMGEFNMALSADKPEIKEIPFVFGDAEDPVVCYGCYQPGDAVFVNIFKDTEKYNLLISPVKMLEHPNDRFTGTVRGWMQPVVHLPEFLEAISNAGVTHHSSLVYGATLSELEYFGNLLGLHVIKIK